MRQCNDHFVAISSSKCASLESLGVPREHISLIPNFVDVEQITNRINQVDRASLRELLSVPEDSLVVLMAGRVIPAKGFDRFVDILARASERLDRPIHGLLVGDGPSLSEVRRIASKLQSRAHVHFLGFQSDVVPFFAISNCALFPTSHPEVLPMFLIECAASGLPVICSSISANKEIVEHEKSGVIVAGDNSVYAEQLAALLSDPIRTASMQAAARDIAINCFDRKTVVAKTIAAYDKALYRLCRK